MAEILKIDPAKPDRDLIFRAVKILQQGGVIAYPTETFYGLGTDSNNEKALDRIFAIKGRDFHKPISLIVGDEKGLGQLWEEIPVSAHRLMRRFWPGPLTIVFKASSSVSRRLTAETGKIGIRISSHPVAAALAKGLGRALTATSANLSGAPECITAEEVLRQIGDGIDVLVDGGSTQGGKGSTILDIAVDPPVILREGMVNASLIGDVLRMASELALRKRDENYLRGELNMDLGDLIVVDHPRHPLHGCVGKVVGRRGQRTPDDPWLLVFMPSRMRSFLIPQSILRLEKAAANHSDHTLQ